MKTISKKAARAMGDDVTSLPAARVLDDGHDWYEGQSHEPAWQWIRGRDIDVMGQVEVSRIENGERVWYRVTA